MKHKHKPAETGEDYLNWSMNCHRAFSTYQAQWQITPPVSDDDGRPLIHPTISHNEFHYAKPNRYRIVSKFALNAVYVVVCDGKREVDDITVIEPESCAIRYRQRKERRAPGSIADASSSFITQPFVCGSPLFKFFGGQAYFRSLVHKSRGTIQLQALETVEGNTCQIVSFMGRGVYGYTEVAISVNDGLVRRIKYNIDSWPRSQMEQLRLVMQSVELAKDRQYLSEVMDAMNASPSAGMTVYTETYTNIQINAPLAPDIFVAEPSFNAETSKP